MLNGFTVITCPVCPKSLSCSPKRCLTVALSSAKAPESFFFLCKEIVHKLQDKLSINSEKNEGMETRLVIPSE
jgi:hypothetical protein